MSTSPTDALPVVPDPTLMPETDPCYDDLVTEDHKPVDRIYVEKLYRLLTHSLYASWPGPGPDRPFLALANVGWFYKKRTPAVVPDVMLSLDVTCPKDLHVKQGHSYYNWQAGKPPDVIIEAVFDKKGGEESFKKNLYAEQGLRYYAVFDPRHILSQETLRTYELVGREYRPIDPGPWPAVGLGLRLWEGRFERAQNTWLRWCDADGEILLTGEERAALLAERARQTDDRLRQADDRLRQADDRIRLLEEELRRLKGDPPAP
jgi:Uma2 family endonuclease